MFHNKLGATFVSRFYGRARSIVERLLRENAHSDRSDLFDAFFAETEKDAEARKEMALYFFTNMSRYADKAETTHAKNVALVAKSSSNKQVDRIVKLALLSIIMPNGKAMRKCTGNEMAAFGSGYGRIAKQVGSKIVGDVLNEKQVAALMINDIR